MSCKDDLRMQAALVALPICIEQSFRVANHVDTDRVSGIGEILKRAAYWAHWAGERFVDEIPQGRDSA